MENDMLEEFENDIEDALDSLEYDLPYELNSYTMIDSYSGNEIGVVEVEFDYDDFDDCVPEYWSEDVEEAIDEAMEDWDGGYGWEDNKIICSINDDD